MKLAEWMIPELSSEAAMTRALLTLIPQDKLDYSPGQDLHTVGWNASHLVEILGWVPGIVQDDAFDLMPVDGPPANTPLMSDISQLLKNFDANLTAATAALQGVPDAVMDEPWSLKMGGQVLFTMKKGDCLRKWVFSHTAHHRAILAVYLRLAGVKVPSVYEG